MRLSIIVAMAENRVIGHAGGIPWHLPGDIEHFKFLTMGKPLIMGRKTFESIGKPLPGRTNIVITRKTFYQEEGIHAVDGLERALDAAKVVAMMEKADEIMVIGGSRIYEMFLPTADRLYVTEVHREVHGDVYFPNFDRKAWRETSRQYHHAEEPGADTPPYSFVVLDRKMP